jgi:hypothetical protein
MASTVGEGFGMALTVYFFIWGMTLPIRAFFRFIGL